MIEELLKVLGIYLLVSIKREASGLSVVFITAMLDFVEAMMRGVGYPLHTITGFIYLRFLLISKKMLFVAFIINLLLHWTWNIQAGLVEYMADSTVICVFFIWAVLVFLVVRPLFNNRRLLQVIFKPIDKTEK